MQYQLISVTSNSPHCHLSLTVTPFSSDSDVTPNGKPFGRLRKKQKTQLPSLSCPRTMDESSLKTCQNTLPSYPWNWFM